MDLYKKTIKKKSLNGFFFFSFFSLGMNELHIRIDQHPFQVSCMAWGSHSHSLSECSSQRSSQRIDPLTNPIRSTPP